MEEVLRDPDQLIMYNKTRFYVIFLFAFVCNLFFAVDCDRRVLHEPLVPIDWTAPPPPVEETYSPPSNTDLSGGGGVPSPPTPTEEPARVSATATQSRDNGMVVKVIIGLTASVVALGLVTICGFFIYRRRYRSSPDPDKLVVTGGSSSTTGDFPLSVTNVNSDMLYLGTVEPSSTEDTVVGGREQNGRSSYQKLSSARASESGYQPSPELHPLPPLVRPPRRVEEPPVPLFSDEDTFCTPHQSTAVSVASESPSSTISRHSLNANVITGKDIMMDSPQVVAPKSRRSSPRSRLSNSSTSDVRLVIPKPAKTTTPPPPPPPPPPPLPHPPPAVPSAEIGGKVLLPSEDSGLPLPVRPQNSSRRQWVRPTCRAEIPVPVAEGRESSRNRGTHGHVLSDPVVNGETADMQNGSKPRLKALHWDKVRASSDRAMVWDQLKSSTFQLDEDMIETLFCNPVNSGIKRDIRRSMLPSSNQEIRVLDPKKSQNIAILLRALNVTREEVSEALLDGNPEGLGAELLETLVKMAPTKEEELRLRDYNGDVTKLGSAECFLKAVIDVPFAFKRIDAMLYRVNFDTEVKYLRKSFETLEAACEELKSSRLFLKLLEAVLKTGNRINVGTNRGEAKAFKLDTLSKLTDVKGVDGKTTLLHFVVQEIIRSEGSSSGTATRNIPTSTNSIKINEDEFKKQGLKVVKGLGKELANVKKAASMDSDVLSSYLSKLELGLDKVKSVMQLGRVSTHGKFFESMKTFFAFADAEISRVKAEERTSVALVKEITEYFHGNAAKEEAHPFRIFIVVKDFLSVLDNVCKEVEKMQGSSTVVGGSGSFRMISSASMPMLQKLSSKQGESSDDDDCCV